MVPPVREDRRGTGVEWLAGLAVLLVAAVLLAATGFRSRDPDSALHAHIAARRAELPLQRWIASEWWGGMSSEGPYREHPVASRTAWPTGTSFRPTGSSARPAWSR
jgi:hypothetical protein